MTTTELRPETPLEEPVEVPAPLDTDVLRRFLDGRFADLREQFRHQARPTSSPPPTTSPPATTAT